MDALQIGRSEGGFKVLILASGPTVALPSLPRWVLDRMAALDMCESYTRVPGLGIRGWKIGLQYRLDATQEEVEEIKRYIKENKRGEVNE